MDGFDLEQAISRLLAIRDRPDLARGCRDSLISFAWIEAFGHHWPSRVTPEIADLREVFEFLKFEERSRFLKQRRLGLNRLVRILDGDLPVYP